MNIKGGATIWARQTIESKIFYDKPDKWFKIWFYIVNKVNHKQNKKWDRGQCHITYLEIQTNTKATKAQIDHCIRYLKKEQMLATQKATRGMHITVVKYDIYQDLDNYKSDTGGELKATQKRHRSDTKNKNVKNDKNVKNVISKTSFADKNPTLISEIIKLFESINPACKKMYGNITQRGACEFLLEEYGFDRVKKIIEAVLPKSNGMEFFPTITTPCKLRDKWADLEFALKKYQGIQKKQVKTIIGLEKFI